jgi:RNA 3'-terminal phosphate cyclase (ATP)
VIRIDGSYGEGGGQILRSALSLSLVTGKPFLLEKIRAGRQKPGLLRQHLTAVLAAAEVGGAKEEGAALGSTSLRFEPGRVQAGDYRFAVGTAGSATLVFQTILPALMLADAPSTVSLEGGTHNEMAPPFHFLAQSFIPLLERMGPRVELHLDRYGFYPAGGGRFRATIHPVRALEALHLPQRGEITLRRIRAVVANLPRHIAEREAEAASQLLGWGSETHLIESRQESNGPGNIVMLEIGSSGGNTEATEVISAFGKLGVSAEAVAATAVREAREYLASTAIAGEHLTDQLLLPMALAGDASFTAVKLNLHATTNMEIIQRFLAIRFECLDLPTATQLRLTTV